MTPRERETWETLAQIAGLTLTDWIRRACERDVERGGSDVGAIEAAWEEP